MKPVLLYNSVHNPYLTDKLSERLEVIDIHADPYGSVAKLSPDIVSRLQVVVGGGEFGVSADLMDKLPALKLIASFGVGYDKIDTTAAKARGIMVTNTPDVLSGEVADLTICLMIAVSRRLVEADAFVRSGQWAELGPGSFPLTHKMSGKKAGIVGMGRIGREIAKRLKAFDMDIAFYGHHDEPGLKRMESLTDLAAFADYLILAVPGRAENRHLINAEVLKALGPTGYLINIARGMVVDEEALTDALEQGVIAGTALDVFECEPKVGERLRALKDRTIMSPHIGSATVETREAMSDLVVANVDAFLSGKPWVTPVPECR